jgi:hypothetical protein
MARTATKELDGAALDWRLFALRMRKLEKLPGPHGPVFAALAGVAEELEREAR